MAVEDKYVDSDIDAGKLAASLFAGGNGAESRVMVATEEIAAADDDTSVYRMFKSVNPNLVPIFGLAFSDAITGSTSWDLGLYKVGVGGAVIDANLFMSAVDLAAGYVGLSGKYALSAINIDSVRKPIWELAGHTLATRLPGYDIAFTANTVGSAAGTISLIMWFAQL